MMMMRAANTCDCAKLCWLLKNLVPCPLLVSLKAFSLPVSRTNTSSRRHLLFCCTYLACFWPFGLLGCILLSPW
jgi:hypothetical protein